MTGQHLWTSLNSLVGKYLSRTSIILHKFLPANECNWYFHLCFPSFLTKINSFRIVPNPAFAIESAGDHLSDRMSKSIEPYKWNKLKVLPWKPWKHVKAWKPSQFCETSAGVNRLLKPYISYHQNILRISLLNCVLSWMLKTTKQSHRYNGAGASVATMVSI
jgi:hypothetical protein